MGDFASLSVVTRLVVGLGNPGPEYAWTPHNLGFHVLERLAGARGALFSSASTLEGYQGPRALRVARDEHSRAWLCLPQTFMNRSGEVVAPLARWAGVSAAEVMVVSDDIDLPPGRLRLRTQGSSGGHRGMQSIVDHLGTDGFPRLRVGVGRPRTDAARSVLAPIPAPERAWFEIAVAEAAQALANWLDGEDLERVMTRFHSRPHQDASPSAKPLGPAPDAATGKARSTPPAAERKAPEPEP